MKATIRDPQILQGVRPLDLVAYLRANRWQEKQRLEKGAVWGHETKEESHELLIPMDATLRDFPIRIAEVLRTLEEVEQRSQLEILEDLSLITADVIRPRLASGEADGSLSLEHGMRVYEHARNLMLAAACSAIERKAVFTRRKPEQAMDYLQRARFGIPKRGSYIVTIISPVPPKLRSEASLLPDETEPFERRTVALLASAVAAMANGAQRAAVSGTIDPMKEAVADGVSANLCEAILGLNEAGGNKGVAFTFSWSPARELSVPIPSQSGLLLPPDAMPILEETVRVFRDTGVVEGSEVLGMIQRLDYVETSASEATIIGTADGQPRSVRVRVSGQDNSTAIRAYEERLPVTCTGELARQGGHWVLQNLRDFRLLDENAAQLSGMVG